ncbi:host nuclease inhibitor GamL, partial [Klebsiella pneumoniae]
MNAYRAYDVIEERKWAEQTLSEEKEKWIEDRAKEVCDSLAEDAYEAL